MKFISIALAAGALVATLGATPAPATVTLTGTNLSFSQMHAACSDALGGITFSAGHVRFIGASNVAAAAMPLRPESKPSRLAEPTGPRPRS
ncbi:MAG: hypothetical protein ACLQPV_07020, partial [Vulcanimicrobiaceae bacterium]